MRHFIANMGQWIGMVAIGAGIGVQLASSGNIWPLIICAGSAVFAVATKCKHHTPGVWVWRRRKGRHFSSPFNR